MVSDLPSRLRQYYVSRATCREAAELIDGLLLGNTPLELNGIPLSLKSWRLLNVPYDVLIK